MAEYTPSTVFVLSGGDYDPGTVFYLGYPSGDLLASLDDAIGLFAGAASQHGALLDTMADAVADFVGYVSPQGYVDGTLADAVSSFVGFNEANSGVMSATLADSASIFFGHYDANVHHYIVTSFCSGQESTDMASAGINLVREYSQAILIESCVLTDNAASIDIGVIAVVEATEQVELQAFISVDAGSCLSTNASSVTEQLISLSLWFKSTVQQGSSLDIRVISPTYQLELIYTDSTHSVNDAGIAEHVFLHRAYGEPPEGFRYIPGTVFMLSSAGNYTPNTVFAWDYAVPPVNLIDNSQTGGVRHGVNAYWQPAKRFELKKCATVQDARRPPLGASIWIDPPRPPPVIPPGHTTTTIPDQSVYIMQHILSVTLLDLTPINMESISLSYDADAYAWQFSGQLTDNDDLALVQQVSGQPPVQLIITINGYTWKVLVERIEHSRKFTQRAINLSGRGLTALLGQPYEQPASATQGSSLTVQQIADLLLPAGWSNNWTAATWLVPGGAFSYTSKTPIQALAALVADIGAMLVPSRNSQVLNIMPRYPVLPWDFSLVPPDVVVPEAAISALIQRPVVPYQANGVYVHGGEVGGVLAWCRLNGTDGARLMSSVSNPLMTDVIGCRALGERLLAAQYTQPAIQSVTLLLDGVTFPLLTAGQLVQVTLDGSPVLGIVNGVTISASLASVRQTVQLGEETPNAWSLFKELLPRDPLLVSTLSSTDGTTSLMSLLDGGVVRVRGTGTVGNKYYIRSGRIDGAAPSMVQNEVVI